MTSRFVTAKRAFFNVVPGYNANLQINVAYVRYDPLFFFFLFFILRRMGKNKAEAPTLPRIRYMSCFDLTHAPAATTARAAATGLVSMSTRPDPEGSDTVEIATRRYDPHTTAGWRLTILPLWHASLRHPAGNTPLPEGEPCMYTHISEIFVCFRNYLFVRPLLAKTLSRLT